MRKLVFLVLLLVASASIADPFYTHSPYVQTVSTTLRAVALADATSITPNADTTDVATHVNTQAVGTLTVNAPSGSPSEGQALVLWIKSTNIQTFAWNAIFIGSSDLALPVTSTGSSKYDYMVFRYNATSTKWHVLGKNFGGG